MTDNNTLEKRLASEVLFHTIKNIRFTENPNNPDEVIAEVSFRIPIPEYMAEALPQMQRSIAGTSNTYEEMSTATPSIKDLVSKLSIEEREEIARLSLNTYIDFCFRTLDPKDVTHVCIAIRRILADVLQLQYRRHEFVNKMKEWQFDDRIPCSMGILKQLHWYQLNSIPFDKWEMSDLWGQEIQRKFIIVRQQGRIFRDMILDAVKSKIESFSSQNRVKTES